MNRDVYFLKSFEEAIGNLSDLADVEGHNIATIGGVTVCIPEDIATKLQPYISRRVGLLRTDTDFRMRILARK